MCFRTTYSASEFDTKQEAALTDDLGRFTVKDSFLFFFTQCSATSKNKWKVLTLWHLRAIPLLDLHVSAGSSESGGI